MPVIGNQGGGGMILDIAINQLVGGFQSYTVPANRVFKGHIKSNSSYSNSGCAVGSTSNNDIIQISTANSSQEQMKYVELGAGTQLYCPQFYGFRLLGNLYKAA